MATDPGWDRLADWTLGGLVSREPIVRALAQRGLSWWQAGLGAYPALDPVEYSHEQARCCDRLRGLSRIAVVDIAVT